MGCQKANKEIRITLLVLQLTVKYEPRLMMYGAQWDKWLHHYYFLNHSVLELNITLLQLAYLSNERRWVDCERGNGVLVTWSVVSHPDSTVSTVGIGVG